MNISHIILFNILIIIIIIIVTNIPIYVSKNKNYNKETLNNDVKITLNNDIINTNDIPINDISYDNELNYVIPDKEVIYNQNDLNRPNSELPHQETNDEDLELKVDQNNILVNTTGDTPIVYSLDELTYTEQTPSELQNLSPSIKPLDAGSGVITIDVTQHNNKLYKLKSLR
jgi:hypothetical protein